MGRTLGTKIMALFNKANEQINPATEEDLANKILKIDTVNGMSVTSLTQLGDLLIENLD